MFSRFHLGMDDFAYWPDALLQANTTFVGPPQGQQHRVPGRQDTLEKLGPHALSKTSLLAVAREAMCYK